MNESQKLAFACVERTTTQLISLSTGLIGLTVVFYDKLGGTTSSPTYEWMVVSWLLLTASTIAGVWTLYALTGLLSRAEGEPHLSLYVTSLRFPSAIQVVSFLLGIGAVILHGVKLIN